jgi:hypothetical protein
MRREVIEQLLDNLPSMYERTREQDAKLGPALEAIKNAMVCYKSFGLRLAHPKFLPLSSLNGIGKCLGDGKGLSPKFLRYLPLMTCAWI